jgi:rhodanese-related sulfurtransferase
MDTIAPSFSVAQLNAVLGSAQQPLIIDVRATPTFDADDRLIAGAIRRDPFTVQDWRKYLPRHRQIVVYCVHGFEISKNVCEALRATGMEAYTLSGGMAEWQLQGGVTVKKMACANVPSAINAPSQWVTRERPKIDRIACPWLIRRFIDPVAEFHYVPANEVLAYASANHANAYDVPGVTFTHRGEQGERCSFDALIEDFELHDAALTALADIVRGADTGKPELTPQSPGLLAVSLGLSQLYQNDHDMLAHGMIMYDALYAWLKSARLEKHNADLFKSKPEQQRQHNAPGEKK